MIEHCATCESPCVVDIAGGRKHCNQCGDEWPAQPPAGPCMLCGTSRTWISQDGKLVAFCPACQSIDNVAPQKPANICPVPGCGLPMRWSGGVLRCMNCGQPK
jgi:hypothetical protein